MAWVFQPLLVNPDKDKKTKDKDKKVKNLH
jgi:hypothetical protein